MSISVKARKAKARSLQNFVRDEVVKAFGFHEDDVQVAIMGESGVDIKLSPRAREVFPYSPECKNQESLSIWAAIKQAEANTKSGTTPILIFKRNRSDPYVVIGFNKFLELTKGALVNDKTS